VGNPANEGAYFFPSTGLTGAPSRAAPVTSGGITKRLGGVTRLRLYGWISAPIRKKRPEPPRRTSRAMEPLPVQIDSSQDSLRVGVRPFGCLRATGHAKVNSLGRMLWK
jgi:hypothetical protein